MGSLVGVIGMSVFGSQNAKLILFEYCDSTSVTHWTCEGHSLLDSLFPEADNETRVRVLMEVQKENQSVR